MQFHSGLMLDGRSGGRGDEVAICHHGAAAATIGTVLRDPLAELNVWNCFCEITQTTGDDRTGCQNDTGDPPLNPVTMQNVHGWCYARARPHGQRFARRFPVR